MTMGQIVRILSGASLAFVAIGGSASASEHCPGGHAVSVVAVDGMVTLTLPDGQMRAIDLGDRLCPGDVVSAGEDGRIELHFAGKETTIGLARNSSVRIPATADGTNVELASGMLRFISSVRDFFTVQTRHANAGIDGTEAVVMASDAAGTLVLVTEGDVTMRAQGQALAIAAGAAGYAAPGGPVEPATADNVPPVFRPILLHPADASDWAIHYPPILLAEGADDPVVAEAARALEAGDPDRAEALLAGRSDARSLALEAVIAVFRNRPADADLLAARAIEADPGLGAAHIAASYALQASGDVDAALEAAQIAVEVAPEDGFAHARLAELYFIVGDPVEAAKAADRALFRQPTSLAHAVRGLAHLQANEYDAAAASFAAGAELDSEDPLPRIGQGLLAIRKGDVDEGRRALELAASLDPRRSSTRTLLGRAYDQENLPEKALSQFDLAIERDPDDPAPWVSAAEVLFAGNRPIEALERIQAAEAREGFRADVRSSRGLDEDRAIHAVALGRVYDTLGFDEQAVQAGARAAEADPASASARRLLAETLRNVPNADIARASSAFAAFVYDGPSKAPIQPSMSETNLALFEGPATTRPSFAELTPFYDSDGFRADLLGFYGTQQTFGDEASFTALHKGFSIGVGQFHYDTDGYRSNNDAEHDIVDVQAKMQVLPMLDLFAEYRYRNTNAEDRTLEFDLADADPALKIFDERNLARGGLHLRAGANHDIAGVFTWVGGNGGEERFDAAAGPQIASNDSTTLDGQAQHVGTFGNLTTVSGFSYTDLTSEQIDRFSVFGFPVETSTDLDADHFSAYFYGIWHTDNAGPFAGIELTGGVSLDRYTIDSTTDITFGGFTMPGIPASTDRLFVNPKVGLRLEVIEGLTLRGAFTRTVTPAQTVSERLEPMTVAGFSQFVDQNNFAAAWQGGIGFDAQVTDWLALGAEASRRRIELPDLTTQFDPEITETEIDAYVNATFGKRFAGTLDYYRLETEGGPGSLDLTKYEVNEMTAGLGWFHPSGFFARGRAGVGWGEFAGINGADSDTFPVTELSLDYRMPNERGIVSLDLMNVVDYDFGFEDRPIEAGPTPLAQPRYAREFTAMARLRLRF